MNAKTSRPRRPRWAVRSQLLLLIPLCAGVAYYGHWQRQLERQEQLSRDAFKAYDLMSSKGVNASFADGLDHATYIFKNGNVTDSDLVGFIPAFNGTTMPGLPRIEAIRLLGSPVSEEAVKRFRQAAPDCELEP